MLHLPDVSDMYETLSPMTKCSIVQPKLMQWQIQRVSPDQNFLNFMQFFGKFVCWRLPIEGWRHLIRGILDPPLLCHVTNNN